MKNIAKRSAVILLMLVMLLGAMSTSTFAAAKTKTVKKQGFTTSTSVINKKATTVKKGTTKLVVKQGQGYIKFVAPKTKKYSFTFSNLKSKTFSSNAYISIQLKDKDSPKYSFMEEVKTKGGRSETLWLSVNGHKFDYDDLKERPIAKRTGTIKLKKGQPIFFYFCDLGGKTTAKLVIK